MEPEISCYRVDQHRDEASKRRNLLSLGSLSVIVTDSIGILKPQFWTDHSQAKFGLDLQYRFYLSLNRCLFLKYQLVYSPRQVADVGTIL
jgi:hypothetical protein